MFFPVSDHKAVLSCSGFSFQLSSDLDSWSSDFLDPFTAVMSVNWIQMFSWLHLLTSGPTRLTVCSLSSCLQTGNTVSNLIMILPPLFGALQTFRSGLEFRYIFSFLGLAGWCLQFGLSRLVGPELTCPLPPVSCRCGFLVLPHDAAVRDAGEPTHAWARPRLMLTAF